MTTFDTSRTTYGVATFASRLAARAAALTTAIVAWNDARSTARALNDLTDRELADVGLTRSDIANVANSNFIR